MTKLYFLIVSALAALIVNAQDTLTKTRFVVGLSAPELLHAGITVDLSKTSQVGFSTGVGPSWGAVWPTLNIEHRLYFGKITESANRRRWFIKQGLTYFTAAESQSAVSFSVGSDLKSRARNRGWTIDLGGFILIQNNNDRKNLFLPELRFQYYSYLKKRS